MKHITFSLLLLTSFSITMNTKADSYSFRGDTVTIKNPGGTTKIQPQTIEGINQVMIKEGESYEPHHILLEDQKVEFKAKKIIIYVPQNTSISLFSDTIYAEDCPESNLTLEGDNVTFTQESEKKRYFTVRAEGKESLIIDNETISDNVYEGHVKPEDEKLTEEQISNLRSVEIYGKNVSIYTSPRGPFSYINAGFRFAHKEMQEKVQTALKFFTDQTNSQ